MSGCGGAGGCGSRGASPVLLKRSVTSDLMACPRAQASHFRLGWLHGVVFLVYPPLLRPLPLRRHPRWPLHFSPNFGWPQGPAPASPLWSLGTASGGFLGGALSTLPPCRTRVPLPWELRACLCGRLARPLPWEQPGAGGIQRAAAASTLHVSERRGPCRLQSPLRGRLRSLR